MTQAKTLGERLAAPTPRFYKKIRNAGLVLAAASAALLATPVALPAVVVQLAGYLAVAGSVATAVAQTVPGGHKRKKDVVSKDTNNNVSGGVVRADTDQGDTAVREDTHRGKQRVKTRKTKSSG